MEYDRIRKEITAYNDIARRNLHIEPDRILNTLIGSSLLARFRTGRPVEGFPDPPSVWIDSRSSPESQLEAYRWLSPIKGTSFLQLGGSGSHGIKAIVGGASRSWLVTPMLEEGVLANRMAAQIGVSRHLHVVLAMGEHLPFPDASIDRIYGGGTLHHMELNQGLREIARVLKPGGRAAFVDPNLNFIYRILESTRIRNLAREPGAQCYPLRVSEVIESATDFDKVRCVLSGGLVRYGIVGATRVLKLRIPVTLSLAVQSAETRALRKVRLGSLLGALAVLVEK